METSVPAVFISENNNIEWKGFPAYSDDRKTILLIHQNYSCCLSNKIEFIELRVSNLTKKHRITLLPNGDLSAFSRDQKEKIIDSVSNIMKRRGYRSVIEIKSFTAKSKTFQLPKMKLPEHCCLGGLPNSGEPCDVTPSINKVWLIPKTKFVLIDYGVQHQSNGCDMGPEYSIVEIRR